MVHWIWIIVSGMAGVTVGFMICAMFSVARMQELYELYGIKDKI